MEKCYDQTTESNYSSDIYTLYQSQFVSMQTIFNSSIDAFSQSGANESYTKAISCSILGAYLVPPWSIKIIRVLPSTVSSQPSSSTLPLARTENAVVVTAVITFTYPVKINNDTKSTRAAQESRFSSGLSSQLTQNVKNGDFFQIFSELSGFDFVNVSVTQTFAQTSIPTQSPFLSSNNNNAGNSPNVASLVTYIVLALVLFFLLLVLLYCCYKHHEESELQKSAATAMSPISGKNPYFRNTNASNDAAELRTPSSPGKPPKLSSLEDQGFSPDKPTRSSMLGLPEELELGAGHDYEETRL